MHVFPSRFKSHAQTCTRVIVLALSVLSFGAMSQTQTQATPSNSHEYYAQTAINHLSIPDKATTFLALGDWGRNGHFYQRNVAKWLDIASYQLDAEFIATTGDNFYDNGVASVDDPFWISSFESVYHQPYLFIDWHPVLGNHDYRGNWQAQIDYSQRSRRWQMPALYYTKTLTLEGGATALIVFIDTSPLNPDYAHSDKYQAAYSQGTDKQLNWLEQTLSQSQHTWKIVIGHHPLYSSGKRYGKADAIKDVLEPILTKHDVDVYIAGHEHDLQHNQIDGQRLVHIVSGGGSEVRPVGRYPFTQFAKSTGGFVAVSLNDQQMALNFIDHQGEVIYHHSLNANNSSANTANNTQLNRKAFTDREETTDTLQEQK